MISRIVRRQLQPLKYGFSSGAIGKIFWNLLDVAFKLHYPEGYTKLFNINSESSAKDVKNLIKEEEGDRFKSLKLILGSKDVKIYVRNLVYERGFTIHRFCDP